MIPASLGKGNGGQLTLITLFGLTETSHAFLVPLFTGNMET